MTCTLYKNELRLVISALYRVMRDAFRLFVQLSWMVTCWIVRILASHSKNFITSETQEGGKLYGPNQLPGQRETGRPANYGPVFIQS
jgi:hypothetical protein